MARAKGHYIPGQLCHISAPTFTDEQCGIPFYTSEFPGVSFIQEGHKTSVSHVMTLRDHIFVLVPKTVLSDLDWRLPVFECGRHLIGFDGTALLLWELWQRRYPGREG